MITMPPHHLIQGQLVNVLEQLQIDLYRFETTGRGLRLLVSSSLHEKTIQRLETIVRGTDCELEIQVVPFPAADMVAHPPHYNSGKIEVIEFIEDQKIGYHLGNTIKYICRAGKKDKAKYVEDLKKARWYLDRKIEMAEAADQNREPVRPNQMGKT